MWGKETTVHLDLYFGTNANEIFGSKPTITDSTFELIINRNQKVLLRRLSHHKLYVFHVLNVPYVPS